MHGATESVQTIPSNQMPCIQIIDTKSNGNNNAEVTQLIRYKNELEELKTKEVAYKQTITKGDTILAKVCILKKNNLVPHGIINYQFFIDKSCFAIFLMLTKLFICNISRWKQNTSLLLQN